MRYLIFILLLFPISLTFAAGAPPVAVSDHYFTGQDTTLTIDATRGVLANDYDLENDSLTLQHYISPPAEQGIISSFLVTGGFTFTPAPTFQGVTVIYYRIWDGFSVSQYAEIHITVGESPNRPPIASPDSYWIGVNQTFTESAPGVLRNDYDLDGNTFAANGFIPPERGTINGFFANGQFTYIPPAGYSGVDTFHYRITDNQANSQYVTVTVYIGLTPGGEMLTNGGFEQASGGWRGVRLTGERRVCNKPQKDRYFAQASNCAFRFIGGAGEASALIQSVNPALTNALIPGDTLTLSAYVQPQPATIEGTGKLRVIALYHNGSKGVVNALVPTSNRYTHIMTPPLTIAAPVRKLKVKISYNGKNPAHTFLIDSVSLARNGRAVPRDAGLMVRGGNPSTSTELILPTVEE